MGGIGVLTNPRSRMNRRNPAIAQQLGYILGEKGRLEQPSDHEALRVVAERFRQHEIDVLCVNGGDGTLHTALTAMVKAYDGRPLPKIAILRTGTMNTVARGARITGNAAQILDFVVQRFHADQPLPTTRRWLLGVDDQQFGFIFGNGLISRFLEAYYEGGSPTPARAVWLLTRAVVSGLFNGPFARRILEPWPGEVEIDGRRWPLNRWMTVAAGTTDDIGVGFKTFFECLTHPGRMHAVGIGPVSPATVIAQMPRAWFARPFVGEGIHDAVTTSLVLRSEQPISYMVDGDFHQGGPEVRVAVHQPLDLVVPEWS